MFPIRRNRRLRVQASLRSLMQETQLSVNDFIVPLFIVEGTNVKDEIASMPNYFRLSLDNLELEIKEIQNLQLKAVLLFVKVPENLKDNEGKEALNENGLMQRAIKTIKKIAPEMVVMTDVALDPYSEFGHDGIVENGIIDNDKTIAFLAKMSVSHAKAGADFVAPSDMMDGRILAIRNALDANNFQHISIMSYSAKYASSHYGPFRDALDSAPKNNSGATELVEVPKDKKTYQMDFHNRLEAITETQMDIDEGADIVMVKPGIAYLDIVRDIKNKFNTPIAVYQVSGEYAMIKAAAEKGWINHDEVMVEQLTAMKRAGATLIASYFAKEIAKIITN